MNKLLEEYSSLRTKGRKAMLNGCHSLWRKQYLWVLKLGKATGRHQPFQRLRQRFSLEMGFDEFLEMEARLLPSCIIKKERKFGASLTGAGKEKAIGAT